MILSHKIKIKKPNKQLITFFNKCFGVYRFIYNYGLDEWQKKYGNKEKVNQRIIRDELRKKIKAGEYSFIKELPGGLLENSLEDLERAYKNFFSKRSKYPKFKSKHGSRKSFRLHRKDKYTIQIKGKELILPRYKSSIKLTENLRFIGTVKTVTIIQESSGDYYASFTIDTSEFVDEKNENNHKHIGIDLGINTLIATTDLIEEGFVAYDLPMKQIKKLEQKKRRLHKNLSSATKGSNRRKLAKTKLAKLYARIKNIKMDVIHKATTDIVRQNFLIGMETLKPSNMAKCHNIAESVMRSSFYTIRTVMEAKAKMRNKNVVLVGQYFPSSQICSYCGFQKTDLKRSDTTYCCGNCDTYLDRDYNAACNILVEAERLFKEQQTAS